MALTAREEELYKQIHPAKLATDWSTTVFAGYLI
jgi:hypothetical protein